eukprot:scaffold4089_cov136-Isochrysis_galbana.AAC.6
MTSPAPGPRATVGWTWRPGTARVVCPAPIDRMIASKLIKSVKAPAQAALGICAMFRLLCSSSTHSHLSFSVVEVSTGKVVCYKRPGPARATFPRPCPAAVESTSTGGWGSGVAGRKGMKSPSQGMHPGSR